MEKFIRCTKTKRQTHREFPLSKTEKEFVFLKANPNPITGKVKLGGSKSISNRVQIIRALCPDDFEIKNLSESKDGLTLKRLLQQDPKEVYDTGHAGTCFRFMTAFLSTKKGTHTLSGSQRMKERPIGPLVTALNSIGANIKYLEKDGFPPLEISSPKDQWKNQVEIDGSMSSQFITALLLIAPTLPEGLTINITGNLVSVPYLKMTLRLLEYFKIESQWSGNSISIKPQEYVAKDFQVEGDWSSASYLYNLVAFNEDSEIEIVGLFEDSLQGDSEIQNFAKTLGVTSTWKNGNLYLSHNKDYKDLFEYNFIEQPDLAQTIACLCAGKNIQGLFNGLQTLFIKETDRVAALTNELKKFGVYLTKLPQKITRLDSDDFFLIEGKLQASDSPISTYQDHRMAMAFATLATKIDLVIEDPKVVVKSFPEYWEVLEQLGFELKFQ